VFELVEQVLSRTLTVPCLFSTIPSRQHNNGAYTSQPLENLKRHPCDLLLWIAGAPRPGFTKATVNSWRTVLEARGLGSVSINVRITAVRKLAVETADNGLLAPELAAGITRVKGVASKGVRVGNWLSIQQAQKLLNTPDVTTKKGLRDRAMLAVLLGCGLRRSEVAALTLKHTQQRDNRWCIVDLVGKYGRVRTIPMPTWVKGVVDAWTVGSRAAPNAACCDRLIRQVTSAFAPWSGRRQPAVRSMKVGREASTPFSPLAARSHLSRLWPLGTSQLFWPRF
jgi:integrase